MKAFFVGLAVASLVACGGGYSSGPSTPPPSGNTPPPAGGISVSNNFFSPATKTVAIGSTVQWSWNSCTGDVYTGQTCTSHSVTFDDGSSSSPTQDHGTFSKTFNAAGTFNYHCTQHPTVMMGTITVQ